MPLRETCISYLKTLREEIIATFETLEETHTFVREPWDYTKGSGGGEIGLVRGGVFEKAAVNFSAVSGDTFPGSDSSGPFFATGVSLITHMHNPHAPTVHFNIRYIETEKGHWFGGGYDLTPMGFPYQEDTEYFHLTAKNHLDTLSEELYPQFSEAARAYFHIPHRNKERGVGGIFFDHYNTGNDDSDMAVWKTVGSSFLDTIMPIYSRRVSIPYTTEEKERQQKLRAHYVEFNLLYDRGTKFGFLSGGNPEAILCSLPPMASW